MRIQSYNEYLLERLRPGKPYHASKIVVFDLDDTLVITDAKIKVCNKKTRECFSLTPEEFNEYEKNPDHDLDFGDFRSYEIMKAGRLIDYYLEIFKRAYFQKTAVGIVTARDSRDMIYRWLKEHVGYHIDKDLIFAINDPIHKFKGAIADRKKSAFKEFVDMGYTEFQFYDDDETNLKLVKSLEREYPQIKIEVIKAEKQFQFNK
jgi:hypothetical protein